MNIKDLPQGAYKPIAVTPSVSTSTQAPLNINNLPKGSYSPIETPQPGFFQGLAQDATKTLITKPVVKTVGAAKLLASTFQSPEKQAEAERFVSEPHTIKYPLIGDVTVEGADTSPEGVARDVASSGLKTVSWLYGGGAVKSGLKTILGKKAPTIVEKATKFARNVTLPGAISGATYGGGQAIEEGKGAGDVVKETLATGALGGLAATGFGAGLAGVGAGVAKVGEMSKLLTKEGRVQNTIAKRVEELDKLDRGYADMRKASGFSADEGKATKLRIASTDVLSNAVDTDGVIRTKTKGGPVDMYRSQTIDKAESVVRDNLENLGEMVNLDTVKANLTKAVNESGLEGSDLTSALNKIDSEIEGYRLKADEMGNIPVTLVHDAKVNQYRNINYLTPPETKSYRKAIARGLKETVEQNSSFPVKQVNDELAKYYEDIAFLERLDGKRVKGGKLGKYFSQISGNIIGGVAGHAVGGPAGSAIGTIVGGELGGRMRGAAMEGTLGGKTGKVAPKSKILEDAKVLAKTPPIYSKMRGNLNPKYKITPTTSANAPKTDMGNSIPIDKTGGKSAIPTKQPLRDFLMGKKEPVTPTVPETKTTPAVPSKLYHGTSAKDFSKFEGITYLTSDPKEAQGFADSLHLGGGSGGENRVLNVSHSFKKVKDIDEVVQKAIDDGDFESVIKREIVDAKKQGYDALSFSHPSTYSDGEFTAYVPVDNKSVGITPKKNPLQSSANKQAMGAFAGVQQDEEGNMTFDPKMAVAGMALGKLAGSRGAKKVGKKLGDALKKGSIKVPNYLKGVAKELAQFRGAKNGNIDDETYLFLDDWKQVDAASESKIKESFATRPPSPNVIKRLSEFKPKEPVKLYRGVRQDQKMSSATGYESWTYDKQVAKNFAGKEGVVKEALINPEDILVDFKYLPKWTEDINGNVEKEVIVKTQKGATEGADNLVTEAKKYKSAEEFVKAQKENPIYKNFTQDIVGTSKVEKDNLLNVPDSGRYAWRAGRDASVLIDNADLPDNAFRVIVGKTRQEVQKSLDENLLKYKIEKNKAPSSDIKKIEAVIKYAEDTKSQLTDIWKKAQSTPALPKGVGANETKLPYGKETNYKPWMKDTVSGLTNNPEKYGITDETVWWADDWNNADKPTIPSKKTVDELSQYKPTEPLTLYRGISNGKANEKELFATKTGYESWTTSKSVAKNYAGKDGTVLEETVDPENILVQWSKLPSWIKSVNGDSEKEVIVKAGVYGKSKNANSMKGSMSVGNILKAGALATPAALLLQEGKGQDYTREKTTTETTTPSTAKEEKPVETYFPKRLNAVVDGDIKKNAPQASEYVKNLVRDMQHNKPKEVTAFKPMDEKLEIDPELKKKIDSLPYQRSTKEIVEDIVRLESSGGSTTTNHARDMGNYGWMVGATAGMVADMDKHGFSKEDIDFSSPEKALESLAKLVDKTNSGKSGLEWWNEHHNKGGTKARQDEVKKYFVNDFRKATGDLVEKLKGVKDMGAGFKTPDGAVFKRGKDGLYYKQV